MPRWINKVILILVVLSFLPLAIVYVTRAQRNGDTRLSIIPDMDDQQRYKAQAINTLFADDRAMRPQVEGTIARGQLQEDPHFYSGIVDGKPVDVFPRFVPTTDGDVPLEINDEFLMRGQREFNIYCTMCHGYGGFGDGLVARRMDALANDPVAIDYKNTWVPPTNLHDEAVVNRPVGHLFNTITNGVRNMPPYGPQIDPLDRWAIVAYVRALQHSQAATIEEVPESIRGNLELRRPPEPEPQGTPQEQPIGDNGQAGIDSNPTADGSGEN